MLMRVAITVAVSQTNNSVCDVPVGGVNDRNNAGPRGSAEAYINGCLRPSRLRKLSEYDPTMGSTNASRISAADIPTDALVELRRYR